MDALDELRKELWREDLTAQRALARAINRGRGRPSKSDQDSQKLSEAKKKATEIKTCNKLIKCACKLTKCAPLFFTTQKS